MIEYQCPMGGRGGLSARGPRVVGRLRPDPATLEQLALEGKEARSQQVTFIVDSGSDLSMVDTPLAWDLALMPTRSTKVMGVSKTSHSLQVYRGYLELPFDTSEGPRMIAFPVNLAGMPTTPQDLGLDGILGRDFLERFVFTYDGPGGRFSLKGEPPAS